MKLNDYTHPSSGEMEIEIESEQPEMSPIKKKILVKQGVETILLPARDIKLFYTVNKLVFCIHDSEKKYLVNTDNLSDLFEYLDKSIFFRANRQVVINIEYIKSFKPIEYGKILLTLETSNTLSKIIISQKTAISFKKWVSNI